MKKISWPLSVLVMLATTVAGGLGVPAAAT